MAPVVGVALTAAATVAGSATGASQPLCWNRRGGFAWRSPAASRWGAALFSMRRSAMRWWRAMAPWTICWNLERLSRPRTWRGRSWQKLLRD